MKQNNFSSRAREDILKVPASAVPETLRNAGSVINILKKRLILLYSIKCKLYDVQYDLYSCYIHAVFQRQPPPQIPSF